MSRGTSGVPSGQKLPLRDWGIVAAVVAAFVALAVAIQVFETQDSSAHVSECGVDAKGPYAKVRVNSLFGGLGSNEKFGVGFTYDGYWYGGGGSTVEVPVFGSTTTLVRGPWPPSAINPHWDGGPRGEPRIRVEGRVVSGHWVNTSVPLQRRWHIKPRFKVRVEPDDPSRLGCEVIARAEDSED